MMMADWSTVDKNISDYFLGQDQIIARVFWKWIFLWSMFWLQELTRVESLTSDQWKMVAQVWFGSVRSSGDHSESQVAGTGPMSVITMLISLVTHDTGARQTLSTSINNHYHQTHRHPSTSSVLPSPTLPHQSYQQSWFDPLSEMMGVINSISFNFNFQFLRSFDDQTEFQQLMMCWEIRSYWLRLWW